MPASSSSRPKDLSMNPRYLIALLAAAGLAGAAEAAVIVSSATLGTAIPDDTDTGFATTLLVPGTPAITSLSVSLNLSVPSGSSGWIGDLYGYVQHGDSIAVLMNRPGRSGASLSGYDDGPSMSVTFTDGAANGDIHTYRSVLTGDEAIPLSGPLGGAWAPDGRLTDPAAVVTGDLRGAMLSAFTGQDPGGTWTLFLADLSGGGRYELESWSLSFETAAVPEPAAVGAVGMALCGWALWRRRIGSKMLPWGASCHRGYRRQSAGSR